jgi:hypothetical protein
MIKTICVFAIVLICGQILLAQKKLHTIRATSNKVDIKDGEYLKKGYWTISPNIKPDIYVTGFSSKPKNVTFYTNIDSISFKVRPNEYIEFNIILQDKDTALTGIYSYFDTLNTLKRASKYNLKEEDRDIPDFTYQSSDNPNLVALRKTYNLDSIAGKGNEISQILSVMHWLHNLVRHENGEYPKQVNALSMIQLCQKENRGLNCRQLAQTLNECYLSLGFKSKYVQCSPKDSLGIDGDCHVINAVFSNTLKKWLWIDPENDAYVMNENGELLSIEEVRERLISGKPLILNPDANWNHRESRTLREYLYSYMAKNLYYFVTPLESQYDLETKQSGKVIKYVTLLPLDYFKQTPIVRNRDWGSGTKTVTYITNNPKLFWKHP